MSRVVRGGVATRRGRCEMSGFMAVPRWTLNPVPGIGEHEAAVPVELVAQLSRLAYELKVPPSTVLLTAHAKVLGAVAGEPEVGTGYAAEGSPPLPCGLTIGPGSWREVLLEIARAESDLLSHCDSPADNLRRELGLTEPLFETVFALDAGGGEFPDPTVLRIDFVERDGLRLRLRYKTDVLDAECAGRIVGYHLTALALIAADPDAEHARQSLLSAEELRFQLDGFAGRRRDLPDRRAHELFEERARAHPDAIAAVHGNRQRTYGELNARANQLARALLARGLSREAVVGVVTERNLDWILAVLAIFKAGAAYLPIEPHFPADRIARMLSRAGCRLLLTERGSTTMLDQALESLSGVRDALHRRRIRGRPCRRRSRHGRRARPARVHLLHLRFNRGAQGRDVRARRHAQPPLRQDRRSGDRRWGRGGPDGAAVLRHLAVATGFPATGRWADPDRRAGDDPRREAFHRQDRRGQGGRRSGRAVLPRSPPILSGAAPPASCRTCGACRPRARR